MKTVWTAADAVSALREVGYVVETRADGALKVYEDSCISVETIYPGAYDRIEDEEAARVDALVSSMVAQ